MQRRLKTGIIRMSLYGGSVLRVHRNDFNIRFDGAKINDTYALSGSAAVDLSGIGHNFGQLNIGTFDLGYSSQLVDTSHTLVIEYVPDTGSTAALLGLGVFVLAAARRRLR